MFSIAAIILENDEGKMLFYLRDDKATIPFPNHWDFFGGHVEEGESVEEALVREVKEELNIELKEYTFFRKYDCDDGGGKFNTKYIFSGKINLPLEKITLLEGQRVEYFSKEEIPNVKFANVLKGIVLDYIKSTSK